jgi:hypothetical protein
MECMYIVRDPINSSNEGCGERRRHQGHHDS